MKIVSLIIAAIVLFALAALFSGWIVMLFVGNASIASGGVVPAFGYWTSVWLTAAVATATGVSRSTKNSR